MPCARVSHLIPPCKTLFFSRIPKVLPAASHRPRLVRHAPPVGCHATDSHLALSFKTLLAGGKAKPFPAPASPPAAVGWRLRFFWPAGRKEFAGLVLGYDPDSGQHTVQWENGPGGRTGVTATNLDDGLVTWVEAPGAWGTATGGGGIPPRKSGTTIAETEKLASSSQKKKKQKLADAGAEAKKKKQKKPPSVPRPKSDETLQEVEKRIGVGTIKGICFQVLRDAGPTGLLLSEIVKRTQQRGLKDWESVNQPSNTVNACCSGDPAFVKVAPGRVGLACLGAMESPDLAAQEEREHGEKVLYCDACRGGPFNTKGSTYWGFPKSQDCLLPLCDYTSH
jgi:hypothetical protein